MTQRFNSSRGLPLLLASLLVLAGCSLAPTYERPLLDTPAAFKEAAAGDSQWKPAQPAEARHAGELVGGDVDVDLGLRSLALLAGGGQRDQGGGEGEGEDAVSWHGGVVPFGSIFQ